MGVALRSWPQLTRGRKSSVEHASFFLSQPSFRLQLSDLFKQRSRFPFAVAGFAPAVDKKFQHLVPRQLPPLRDLNRVHA